LKNYIYSTTGQIFDIIGRQNPTEAYIYSITGQIFDIIGRQNPTEAFIKRQHCSPDLYIVHNRADI
jgi:hypothetical protein